MKTFKVEQYELWIQSYTVQAKTEAEAIAKVLNGDAAPDNNSLELVEVAEDYGMPREELDAANQKQLGKLGHPLMSSDIINSIRSITIEGDDEE